MIDMPTIESIHSRRARGDSIAEIARAEGISEPTVRKYLKMDDFSPKFPARKQRFSILDPYKDTIERWLDEDANTWHKQQHTAKKIYERLVRECGAQVGYTTVQAYVKQQKEERRLAADQFLKLEWEPGEAQVDFGQAEMSELGVRQMKHYLVMDFPYSNVGPAQVFDGENAECVCQGLKNIFEYVGGVPRRLVFDNAAGIGRKMADCVRTSELFARFALHYGFAYSFCNPYSGHEKGAVENKVGATRRDLFVPLPRFENIHTYNKRLLDRCMARSEKAHYAKGEPEIQLFVEDSFALLPLPEKDFDVVSYETMKTDKYGRVCLDGRHRYSSDPSLGLGKVVVGKAAFEVRIYTLDGTLVATHRRAYGATPTDSEDPLSQLGLLCLKPNGWQNSVVRHSLPGALRQAIDCLDKPARASALRALRDISAEMGYKHAVAGMLASVESLGQIDVASSEIMARALADERGCIVYDEEVGLGDYDVAFSAVGGGEHESF